MAHHRRIHAKIIHQISITKSILITKLNFGIGGNTSRLTYKDSQSPKVHWSFLVRLSVWWKWLFPKSLRYNQYQVDEAL